MPTGDGLTYHLPGLGGDRRTYRQLIIIINNLASFVNKINPNFTEITETRKLSLFALIPYNVSARYHIRQQTNCYRKYSKIYNANYSWVQTTLFSQLISLNSWALTLILSQML